LGNADPGPAFDWHGRIAFCCAAITLLAVAFGAWIFVSGPPRIDFLSFWAAGQLTIHGHPSLAYDYKVHRAVEASVAHLAGPMPFPYPPPFLLAVVPFGFQPVWLAYLLWSVVTIGLYVAATRKLLPTIYALAHPAAFMNAVGGQNGFLTCSVFAAGTSLLEKRPFLGGLVLGLLVCKPQLALLLPVAVIAGRHWRAIYGAALSSTALLAIAAAFFGLSSYSGFFKTAGEFTGFMAASAWRWNQFASVFGLARYAGVPQTPALLLHGLCACAAILVTWRAWSARMPQRVPILASASLLMSPYLFTYDSLLLVISLAWFVREREPLRLAFLWLGSLAAAVAAMGLGPVQIPNIAPLLAIGTLWWLYFDRDHGLQPTPLSIQSSDAVPA
jgi:hypothetical protein